MEEYYNYLIAETEDIMDYLKLNPDLIQNYKNNDYVTFDDYLRDQLWNIDDITGNASGSYTFNTLKAEENLVGNWELLHEAIEEFGLDDCNILKQGPEICDVTIRCYLLDRAIPLALDKLDIH